MAGEATFLDGPEGVEVAQPLLSAFASLHKLALGVACGVVSGLLLFMATAFLIVKGGSVVGPNMGLLSNYFPGFSVDWPGSVIGFLWASAGGFVVGWLVAFLRNLFLALYLFLVKTRAEVEQYGDFIDYI